MSSLSGKKKPPIVLDKSFLFGASAQQLEALGREYIVVVSDALILEMLTTGAFDRCRCGQRLSSHVGTFQLVESVPALLRFEMATLGPASPVLEKVRHFESQVGRRMCRWKLELRAKEVMSIQTWRADVDEALEHFLKEAETIPEIFEELRFAKEHERKEAALAFQRRIALDPEPVRQLHGEMKDARFPAASLLDESWVFYRRLQVHFFAALEEYGKHGPRPASWIHSKRSKEELRNKVVDFDYRVLGLLVGSLATLDGASARAFRALSPSGTLLDKSWQPAMLTEGQAQ